MTEIDRFDYFDEERGFVLKNKGDWVRYDDYFAELARLREENARLVNESKWWRDQAHDDAAMGKIFRERMEKAERRLAEALEVLQEIDPICDIREGLAPYYIHSDTIKRIRAAIAGKGV